MTKKASVKGRKFTVVLDKDEDGGYSVQCVELPAAISQGDTKKEALKNIKEAIELVLDVLGEKARKQKPEAEFEEIVV
jgi:predicted RNase H-like HicB family nuclease